MEEKYIQGTRKRKIQFYLGMAIAIATIIFFRGGWYKELTLPDDSANIEEIRHYLISQSFWSISIAALFIFISIYLTKHAFNYAKRIETSGEYPPPGAQIPFTHKVYTGRYARNCALSLKFTSVLYIAFYLGVMAMEIYLYFKVYTL